MKLSATELLLKQENDFLKKKISLLEKGEAQLSKFNTYLDADVFLQDLSGITQVLSPQIRICVTNQDYKQLVVIKTPDEYCVYAEHNYWLSLNIYDKAKFVDYFFDNAKEKLVENLIKSTDELKFK